jgi:hypothetical protein
VRDPGSFNLQISTATVQEISHKYCHLIELGDRYGYHLVSHVEHLIGKECASSSARAPRSPRMNKMKEYQMALGTKDNTCGAVNEARQLLDEPHQKPETH